MLNSNNQMMLNSEIGRKKKGAKSKKTSDFTRHEFYMFYKKNGGTLAQGKFSAVVDEIHKLMADELACGRNVTLPCGIGELEPTKRKRGIFRNKEGKLESNCSVDWGATKKLWMEDEEAYKNHILVKRRDEYNYYVIWRRKESKAVNAMIYYYVPVRSLKHKTRKNIDEGIADARNLERKLNLL